MLDCCQGVAATPGAQTETPGDPSPTEHEPGNETANHSSAGADCNESWNESNYSDESENASNNTNCTGASNATNASNASSATNGSNASGVPARQRSRSSAAATCSFYPKCVAANLSGTCCPSGDGAMLDCCQAECSAHRKCSVANLTGFCCPTAEGARLDCCPPFKGNRSSHPGSNGSSDPKEGEASPKVATEEAGDKDNMEAIPAGLTPVEGTSLVLGSSVALLGLNSRVFQCGPVYCASGSICCQSRDLGAALCCSGSSACRFSSYDFDTGIRSLNAAGLGSPRCFACTGAGCENRTGGSKFYDRRGSLR